MTAVGTYGAIDIARVHDRSQLLYLTWPLLGIGIPYTASMIYGANRVAKCRGST